MQQNVTLKEKISQESLQKIKTTKKLKIIAILQVDTEVHHITFVI